MDARLISFGLIEIDGQRFEYDVVLEQGAIRKRKKGPSKVHRERYGHTPLSADEAIPWSASVLIIGTGGDYVAKRMAAGDSKTEAIRALRRRISDEVFRRMRHDEDLQRADQAPLPRAA